MTQLSLAEDRLIKGLRAIVREVLEEEDSKTRKPKPGPTGRDAFWLVLLVADVGLFLAWLPTAILKNEQVGILSKFLPWAGSGAYVLGYTWFREHILRWSRQFWFKALQVTGIVVLPVLLFVRIPIVIEVEPSAAQLWLDGKQWPAMPENGNWKVGLELRSHHFEIRPAGPPQVEARSVDVHWTQLGLGVLTGNRHFYWPLIYPVNIVSRTSGYTITIGRDESNSRREFDADFLENHLVGSALERVAGSTRTIRLRLGTNLVDATIDLPYGDYTVTATKEGCDPKSQHVGVKPENVALIIDFEKLQCRQ